MDALARGLEATDLNAVGRPGSDESPDGESPGDKASSFAPLETTSVLASSSVVWAGGATACSREGARARARWWRAQARAALAAMRAAATRPGGSGSSEGKGAAGTGWNVESAGRRWNRSARGWSGGASRDVLVGGGGGRADGRDRLNPHQSRDRRGESRDGLIFTRRDFVVYYDTLSCESITPPSSPCRRGPWSTTSRPRTRCTAPCRCTGTPPRTGRRGRNPRRPLERCSRLPRR